LRDELLQLLLLLLKKRHKIATRNTKKQNKKRNRACCNFLARKEAPKNRNKKIKKKTNCHDRQLYSGTIRATTHILTTTTQHYEYISLQPQK